MADHGSALADTSHCKTSGHNRYEADHSRAVYVRESHRVGERARVDRVAGSRCCSHPGSVEFPQELRESEQHARSHLRRHQSVDASREHDRRQRELHLDIDQSRHPAGEPDNRARQPENGGVDRGGRGQSEGAERTACSRAGGSRRRIRFNCVYDSRRSHRTKPGIRKGGGSGWQIH